MPVSLRENLQTQHRLPRNDAVLMGRAELLAPDERDLIEAILIRGQKTTSIARLMGIPAKRLRQRMHRISRRLSSRSFLRAARALAYLPADEARLAQWYFCQRIPRRELRDRLGLTPHQLRRRIDRLSAQIDAINRLHSKRSRTSAMQDI